MEAKPFNLQSPEKVAETYGGNKQKIAQAIQMGVIDPTSGLLAGMFIDRMRSAQMMEQAPQASVAQKVFSPPAAPVAPAGLGAMAPQAASPVGMAAGGMAELPEPNNPYNTNAGGGLTTLPVPEDMYDEHSFAGGGIVAFAAGGDERIERLKALQNTLRNPNFLRESTYAERKAIMQEINELSRGAEAEPSTPATELDQNRAALLRTMSGGSKGSELPVALQKRLASNAYRGSFEPPPMPNIPVPQATQATPPSFNVAPPATGLGAIAPARVAPASAVPTPSPRPDLPTEAPVATAASQPSTVDDFYKMFAEAGKLPDFQKMSAEDRAARKNEDLWSALAQIGFGMAAGESPNALTNIGKATAAAVPGMQASLKERRADEKDERNREFDYLMKASGVKGDALKAAVTAFNSAEDRNKDVLLARLRMEFDEKQQEKQFAHAEKITGIQLGQTPAEVRFSEWFLSQSPERRAQLMDYRQAGLNLRTNAELTAAEADIDKKYEAQLRRAQLDAERPNASDTAKNKYATLLGQIAAEKKVVQKRFGGLRLPETPPQKIGRYIVSEG